MYCPRCGQQQASTEMRFCSRCGFALGGVTELLANDGVPGPGGDEPQEQTVSPRRKGVSKGVRIMLLGAVIVPLLGVLSNYNHNPKLELLVALSAVLFFLGGFVRILYALLFEQSARGKRLFTSDTPAALKADKRVNAALPPPQTIPASSFTPRRANTAELVPPPSVTENTTRLLDEDKE
jgi:hypothetical protein